ncbi:MAG: hypothetical protein HYY67_06030 [Thaumarchaeota archaeon]|nr:hypothetical protein [Nitrososphaerota archaeon]
MRSIVVITAAVVIAAAVAGGVVLSSPGTIQPVSSQPPSSQPPQQAQPEKITPNDIKNAPSNWAGKSVNVEGMAGKDGLLSSPYLLEDKGASLSITSKEDLDKYVGLKVQIAGIVRYNPNVFDASRTSIEIQSIKPLAGEPTFFVEIIKNGQDDKGRPTTQRDLIFDNSGKLVIYETKVKLIAQTVVTQQRMEDIRKMLLDSDIFSIQQNDYPALPAMEAMNYESFTYTIKVVLRVGNEVKETKLTWPEPANIPPELQKLQTTVNNILKVDGQ